MLFVNFKAYNSYVTDSLYQWDINQTLNIVGLNLTEAPEVHFANANMERAIVRQATINNGAITVTIPNSLLQEPLPIKAYIGIYEGETFKVIEFIKIPVIPKERPTDYVFVDDGGDIYSYNEILNRVTSFENNYNPKDIADLKTRVTPIDLGGTGATTVDGALKNLVGLWNLDKNVGCICAKSFEKQILITGSEYKGYECSSPMIHSGRVQLRFYIGAGSSSEFDESKCSISVYQNENIIENFWSSGDYEFELDVKKGDEIKIVVKAKRNKATGSTDVDLKNVELWANIETPYKYNNLILTENEYIITEG